MFNPWKFLFKIGKIVYQHIPMRIIKTTGRLKRESGSFRIQNPSPNGKTVDVMPLN